MSYHRVPKGVKFPIIVEDDSIPPTFSEKSLDISILPAALAERDCLGITKNVTKSSLSYLAIRVTRISISVLLKTKFESRSVSTFGIAAISLPPLSYTLPKVDAEPRSITFVVSKALFGTSTLYDSPEVFHTPLTNFHLFVSSYPSISLRIIPILILRPVVVTRPSAAILYSSPSFFASG